MQRRRGGASMKWGWNNVEYNIEIPPKQQEQASLVFNKDCSVEYWRQSRMGNGNEGREMEIITFKVKVNIK